MPKNIQVGQLWRTRGGEVVLIKSKDDTSYPFNLSPRSCVTADGREYDDGSKGALDLVRLVRKNYAEPARAGEVTHA